MGYGLLFYLFSTILIASAVTVIVARNTVYSVLFLILGFLNAAGLFILLGAEFIAMTFIIVYVGAVAVLFLFVVMMLDIKDEEGGQSRVKYSLAGLFFGLVSIIELSLISWYWKNPVIFQQPVPSVNNTQAIGSVLYTDYFLIFQLAGLILLVAMIGAIVLAMRHRPDIRRQNVRQQLLRDPSQTLELKDIESGKGINI